MGERHWRNALCRATDSLTEALAVLDRSGSQICLVADSDDRLMGVLTDGDFRRLILGKTEMEQQVGLFVNRGFVFVREGSSRDSMLRLFKDSKVHQVPVLDSLGRVVDLFTIDDVLMPPRRSNHVVIMAGGMGTRLGKLTEEVPKPMLPVGGQPILEVVLGRLRSQGFLTVTLCVGYLKDRIISHFGDGEKFGMSIDYVEEEIPRGTAGSLAHLPRVLQEPFVVMNADLITNTDLGFAVDEHASSGADLSILTRPHEYTVPFGVVEHVDGRIVEIREKPTMMVEVSMGMYILNPSVLSLVPADSTFDMPELISAAIGAGLHCAPVEVSDYWIDIGRVEELERARFDFDSGRMKS